MASWSGYSTPLIYNSYETSREQQLYDAKRRVGSAVGVAPGAVGGFRHPPAAALTAGSELPPAHVLRVASPAALGYQESKIVHDPKSRLSTTIKEQRQSTLWDVIKLRPDLKQWAALVKKAGFDELLNNPQVKITVFVVPDQYMYQIPGNLLSRINKFTAKDLVGFHTLKAPFALADFTQTPMRFFANTFHPHENILVNSMSMNIYLGIRPTSMSVNPTVTSTVRVIPEGSDVEVSNGFLHSITGIVVPQQPS